MYRRGWFINYPGVTLSTDFPFISGKSIEEARKVFSKGEVFLSEEDFSMDDRAYHCEIIKVPVFEEDRVVKVIIVIRDRSKEKEMEVLKQKSAEEKEILLREIHHRVKNNLAIVISLLNFQIRRNKNKEVAAIIQNIQIRIRSMALIHEHLYLSGNLNRIPLASYMQSLVTVVQGSYKIPNVTMSTHLEPVAIHIETALPIGLIVSELLINAFKHAFPHGGKGEISIRLLSCTNDTFCLEISDNGVGLPQGYAIESADKLGLFIVNLLVEQLEGEIEITHGNGTSFLLRFKENMDKIRIKA
jgi:two-component sensor histidine kinase